MTTCRINCAIGSKGSGKTFLFLARIYKALKDETHGHVFAYIPNFYDEEHASYAFLRLKEFDKKVTICSDSRSLPEFIDMIIARQRKKKEIGHDRPEFFTPVMLLLDDATAYMHEAALQRPLVTLATDARHIGIEVMMCIHSLKGVALPAVRNNIDRLYIGKMTNAELVNDLRLQYLSWFFPEKKHFDGLYLNDVLMSKNHNFLALVLNGETVVEYTYTMSEGHTPQASHIKAVKERNESLPIKIAKGDFPELTEFAKDFDGIKERLTSQGRH